MHRFGKVIFYDDLSKQAVAYRNLSKTTHGHIYSGSFVGRPFFSLFLELATFHYLLLVHAYFVDQHMLGGALRGVEFWHQST